MEVSEQEKQKIRDFIRKGDEFFVGWFNGSIDRAAIEDVENLMDDGLKILYSEMPDRLMSKSDLLHMLPQYYGRSQDNPVARENEFRHWLKVGEDKILAQYQEHTVVEGEIIRTRSLSVIIRISEPMKLLYSHE